MDIREKILNNEKLDADEVYELVWDTPHNIEQVDVIEGEDRRWLRTNIVILKIDDRYFEINYEQGLTECQENEYDDQIAIEVQKVERVTTIIDWVPLKKESK